VLFSLYQTTKEQQAMDKLPNRIQIDYTDDERHTINIGLESYRHLIKTVAYWINVGHAMNVLATKGEPLGRQGFVALQVQEGFITRENRPIDKALVSRARMMADNEAAVLAWHAGLTEKQRERWNNPNSVFNHCPLFARVKAATSGTIPTRRMPVIPKIEAWAQPDAGKPTPQRMEAKARENAEQEARTLAAQEQPLDVLALLRLLVPQAVAEMLDYSGEQWIEFAARPDLGFNRTDLETLGDLIALMVANMPEDTEPPKPKAKTKRKAVERSKGRKAAALKRRRVRPGQAIAKADFERGQR
jgi:hypothetical protein